MAAPNRADRRLSGAELRRIVKRAEKALKPYEKIIYSPKGEMAGLALSLEAFGVVAGKTTQHAYKALTNMIADELGIPRDAMTAHADFFLFMARKSAQLGTRTGPDKGGA